MPIFKWVMVFYHAQKEVYRAYGEKTFTSKAECMEDVLEQSRDIDYCCGMALHVIDEDGVIWPVD